jgi:toxin ParE1/3/4
LEESIMGLGSMLFRFKEYDFEPWKSRGLHIMTVNNFVVLYSMNEETAVVTKIRVMYGGRDIEKQLNEYTEFR